MKVDSNKLLVIVVGALLACCAWWLQGTHSELVTIREQVFELRLENYEIFKTIELMSGGDPDTVPKPEL